VNDVTHNQLFSGTVPLGVGAVLAPKFWSGIAPVSPVITGAENLDFGAFGYLKNHVRTVS